MIYTTRYHIDGWEILRTEKKVLIDMKVG